MIRTWIFVQIRIQPFQKVGPYITLGFQKTIFFVFDREHYAQGPSNYVREVLFSYSLEFQDAVLI